jgi:hypothetical protein
MTWFTPLVDVRSLGRNRWKEYSSQHKRFCLLLKNAPGVAWHSGGFVVGDRWLRQWPWASSQRSASMAAMHPEPAAVIA